MVGGILNKISVSVGQTGALSFMNINYDNSQDLSRAFMKFSLYIFG